MNLLLSTVIIGIGATAIMDAWGIVRRPLLGLPPPDYGLVGRWIAYMPRGRFRHASIAAAAPVRGERVVGWTAHYLTGIAYAGILVGLWGVGWVAEPTILPALGVGLGTVAAPFLLMQPGMGAGLAARRTPHPGRSRIQTVLTHAIFGLGLYAAGWFASVAPWA
jgi:hypothetical protein